MVTISKALPIHFWLIGENTFNEFQPGFVLKRPYYHQWLGSDIIKLQLLDTNLTNKYALLFVDENKRIITYEEYTKTVIAGVAEHDIEFTFAGLDVAIVDQRVRVYIAQNFGSLDGLTLDSQTLDTASIDSYDLTNALAKSDYMDVFTELPYNQGWATETINYKSLSNYAELKYPNNGNFFNLRIPCRLFNEREQNTVNEIQLSDEVLVTSRTTKYQIYLEPYQLPAYMLKKISYALKHGVTGSAQINGTEYEAEAFEWSPVDVKAPFFKGKVWLTDKNNFDRNII